MRALPSMLILLSTVCVAGCAPPGDDSQWYASPEDGKADGADWTGPRLFGHYASRFEIRVRAVDFVKHPECATVPIVEGDACWNLSTNHGAVISGLTTVTQNGGNATLTSSVCNMRNTRYVNAKISEKAYPRLAPTSFKAKLAPDGNTETSPLSLSTDAGLFIYGVKKDQLANPMTDPLPRDKKDPRVDDPDQDGQPGLTFDDQIRVYVGTRFVTPLAASSGEGGALSGLYRSATVAYDFVVYGDGIWGIDPAIGQAEKAQHDNRPIEQTTQTTLLPLRSDAPTCADALAALPVLNLPIPTK